MIPFSAEENTHIQGKISSIGTIGDRGRSLINFSIGSKEYTIFKNEDGFYVRHLGGEPNLIVGKTMREVTGKSIAERCEQLEDSSEKLTGRGGPGRGQGLKPMFGDEAMPKKPVRLSPEMMAYLGEGEQAAADKLRRLLEWSWHNEDKLLPVPKRERGSELVRTSFAMAPAHWQRAELLGGGVRVNGIRRVIHTAMELEIDI